MASTAFRERRRTLRYCNLLVRQMVQKKNKVGKQELHKAGHFRELLVAPDIDEGCVRCCD